MTLLSLLDEIEGRAKAATHAKPYAPYSATQAQDTLAVSRLLRESLKVVEACEPLCDWSGKQLREPATVTARNVETALASFRTACAEMEE